MTEKILHALMQLFAMVSEIEELKNVADTRTFVRNYLQRHLNKELVDEFSAVYESYLESYAGSEGVKNGIKSLNADIEERYSKVCHELNEELTGEPKILILVELLEFIKNSAKRFSKVHHDFVKDVAEKLNIQDDDYENLKAYILYLLINVPDPDRILIINGIENFRHHKNYKHIYSDRLRGNVYILHIKSTNTFLFRYVGQRNFYLNGHKIETNKTYPLSTGSIIKTSRSRPVYYSHVAGKFIHGESGSALALKAYNVDFRFPGGINGIRSLNFQEESGRFVGIVGSSGSGKSTLINILNGNLQPQYGKITINGYDINEEPDALKGVIGFVPQEDMLIEELTTYQNLYYNAKLCFKSYSKEKIKQVVEQALIDFDLLEAKDLKVGTPLRKYLSGGQRKRLNIALELMREPSILFVDEPTSGLSSMDSDKVMALLKRQTIKGKLVIVNIHQPSSDLFKLLDRLIILDQGGRLVYNGYPLNSLPYFKEKANYVNPEETECLSCGNVKAEQPLRIIEARMVDTHGRLIRKRKVSPEEWYENYKNELEPKFTDRPDWDETPKKRELPKTSFLIPGKFKQLLLFIERTIQTKLENKQYLFITLLEAPLLAFILVFFTKYFHGTPEDPGAYVFIDNKNLPVYLFMSTIVMLFLGMMVSAEEIIKDRKLIKRESFLNLNKASYLNSKIAVVFFISAVQSALFVTIGNSILEIQDMWFRYWLALFTTSCVANMIGLNLSAGLNSVITIYITIPVILVPQLLFSGVVVNFNDLHKAISSEKYVPAIGDIMASRWCYEALAVEQFKDNDYNRHFFHEDMVLSQTNYKTVFLLPAIQTNIYQIQYVEENQKRSFWLPAKNSLLNLVAETNLNQYTDYIQALTLNSIDKTGTDSLIAICSHIREFYSERNKEASKNKDHIYKSLVEKLGKDGVISLKKDNHNLMLNDILLDRLNQKKVYNTGSEFIQRKDPIYLLPDSHFGRAHFYAPMKRVGDTYFETYWFNIIVLWISILFFYLFLVTDMLRKIIEYIERIKLKDPKFAMHKRV